MPRRHKTRTVGDFRKKQIEVRYPADTRRGEEILDEVVALDAYVHLEMMDDSTYSLIVETQKERACFFIHAKNGKSWLRAHEFWRDPVNRRSEAAKRRENRKRWK